jgi:hypothetical protein
MTLKLYIFSAVIFLSLSVKSQHTIYHTNMIWTGYYNAFSFNKNWSLINDAQLRTKDWIDKWSQILIRSGLSYKLNDKFSITAGFAFFKSAQSAGKDFLFKNEWRPWQEVSYQSHINKLNITQKLRTEQRFLQQVINNKLSTRYQYIFRLRYRFDLQIPVQKNIKLIVGNEILVNPDYLNDKFFFDQNRIFGGANFKLNANTSLQLQYLKLIQWHSNTSVLDDVNVLRINIYQQFNFKRHESK